MSAAAQSLDGVSGGGGTGNSRGSAGTGTNNSRSSKGGVQFFPQGGGAHGNNLAAPSGSNPYGTSGESPVGGILVHPNSTRRGSQGSKRVSFGRAPPGVNNLAIACRSDAGVNNLAGLGIA